MISPYEPGCKTLCIHKLTRLVDTTYVDKLYLQTRVAKLSLVDLDLELTSLV